MAACASPALAARRSTRRAAARSPLAIKSSPRLSDAAISLGSRWWVPSPGIMSSGTGAGGGAATGAAAGGAAAKAEIERAKRKPTESLDAYALYLRGLPMLYQFASRQTPDEALRLFNSAIEFDPDFASAYAGAALCYVWA